MDGSAYLFEGINKGAQAFAEGVQQYQKNRSESQFLDAQLDQMMKFAPEFGVRIDPEEMVKYSSGNLNAKRATVTGLAMQMQMAQQKEQREAMNEYRKEQIRVRESQQKAQDEYRKAQLGISLQGLNLKREGMERDDFLSAERLDLGRERLKLDREKMERGEGGEEIELTPGGVVIRRGGAAKGATTAFKTEAQKKQADYGSAVSLINHIESNMAASDFGIAGQLGDFKDKWLAQVKPDEADPRRIDVRATLSQVRETLLGLIKNDSNLSNIDRQEMMASLPSLKAGESYVSAAQKLSTAKNMLVTKVRSYSKQLGDLPPTWAMNPQEIKAALQAGLLDEQAAVAAIKQYHPTIKLP